MKEYISTFYTHADAIIAHRNLTSDGVKAKMMPVPRKLSSSCGTCVRYTSPSPYDTLLGEYEALYEVCDSDNYVVLRTSN